MKRLVHKVLIYDDVCPLCKSYTNGFVQLGWLLPENRMGFSEAPESILSQLDLNRARHEIPLYDKTTNEVLYGKDALFFILGEQFPVLKPLFHFKPFRAIIFVLYQIITYNRRIIASTKSPEGCFDCAPDFNVFYRWLYIFIAFGLGIVAQFSFFKNIDNQSLSILFVVFGSVILYGLTKKGIILKTDYFGHLATVFLILCLLKLIFYTTLFHLPLLLLGIILFVRRNSINSVKIITFAA